MALASTGVLDVRPGGSDTANGGGFNPGNTGFPTDLTATSATGGSPVVSSASYNFVAGDVGHWVFVKSGTNWTPGWYQIASVSGGSATLTATAGAGVLYEGGVPSRLTTAAGVASTASPIGGTWGIDYSKADSARLTFTDLVIGVTTTQFTSAGNPVGKNFVGNLIRVTGGTGFTAGVYEVASTSGTTATCDRSLGTGGSTGGTGGLGGGLASPGAAGAIHIGGMTILLKSGTTYSVTSASTNVAGGCLSLSGGAGSTTTVTRVIGYASLPFDAGTKPVLQAVAISSFFLIGGGVGNNLILIDNVEADGNSRASSTGIRAWGTVVTRNCLARNCTNNGFYCPSGSAVYQNCYATGCTSQTAFNGVSTCRYERCEARGNSITGFTGGGAYLDCVSCDNSGASSDGFNCTAAGTTYTNITAANNGRAGWTCDATGDQLATVTNGLFYGNTGAGVRLARQASMVFLCNVAAGNNSGGRITASTFVAADLNAVALTADPFTNAAGGNYALNSTAGGGAACRAAGIPGAFPSGATTGYRDIGAVQHQDAGGGGAGPVVYFGGMR